MERTIANSQNLRKCLENLKLACGSACLSLLDYLFGNISHAVRVTHFGPSVRVVASVLANNKRYLVGGLFLGLGIVSLFLHQFFPEATRDWHWYFLNKYYFFLELRLPLVLIFWSAAGMLYSPAKWRLAYIPFCLVHAAGWLYLLHYTVFINPEIHFTTREEMLAAFHEVSKQYNAVPDFYAWVMAIALGISIILSLDFLLYRYNHIIRNNHASCIGLLKIKDVPTEIRDKHAATLVENYTNINARI